MNVLDSRSLFAPALGLALLLGCVCSPAASADTGFYIGGGIGSSSLQIDIEATNVSEAFNFDERDFAWKAFGGFEFDVPFLIGLGIEGGYVDLGKPSASIVGESLAIDVTGFDAFGVASIDLGPLGLFAKAGVVAWDAELSTLGTINESLGEDGTDFAYGVGARAEFGNLQVRGEFEGFQIDDVDAAYLITASLVWRF